MSSLIELCFRKITLGVERLEKNGVEGDWIDGYYGNTGPDKSMH